MLEPLFDKNNIGKLCVLQNGKDKRVCLYAGYILNIDGNYWFLFLFDKTKGERRIKIGNKRIVFEPIDKKQLIKKIVHGLTSVRKSYFNLNNYNPRWKFSAWFWENDEILKSFSLLVPTDIDYMLNLIKDELV